MAAPLRFLPMLQLMFTTEPLQRKLRKISMISCNCAGQSSQRPLSGSNWSCMGTCNVSNKVSVSRETSFGTAPSAIFSSGNFPFASAAMLRRCVTPHSSLSLRALQAVSKSLHQIPKVPGLPSPSSTFLGWKRSSALGASATKAEVALPATLGGARGSCAGKLKRGFGGATPRTASAARITAPVYSQPFAASARTSAQGESTMARRSVRTTVIASVFATSTSSGLNPAFQAAATSSGELKALNKVSHSGSGSASPTGVVMV
mmetsp:Transcript_129824/g.277111  ORF Transcript_129824/g.277111 Transcript_129824/m.277111 type:complete len:261 (-) Transcript_129824:30-812(-)